MELTLEQLAAADHGGRRLLVVGAAGTGKTATLLARYRRLLARHPASRVLVVCRSREAAQRTTTMVLPLLREGFDALPITSVHGLAHDLVVRSGRAVRLLVGAERPALIGRLLEAEDPADWPVMGRFLPRPSFAAEVADALDVAREAGLEMAGDAAGPWPELARFARRYSSALESAGRLDAPGLVGAAAAQAAANRGRFDHVLVDDAHALTPTGARLLAAIMGGDTARTVTADPDGGGVPAVLTRVPGDEVRLTREFRASPPGRLLRCDHPSVEAEAVANELLQQHANGVAWSDMAIVLRHLGRRARSMGRALARHGIPAVPVPALAADEPVVRAVLDLLRWVDGDQRALDRLLVSPLAHLDPIEVRRVRQDAVAGARPLEADPRLAHLVALRDHLQTRLDAGDSPADLAYEAWAHALVDVGDTQLGAVDDRALDGLVSFIDGLAAHGDDRRPGATLASTLAAIAEGGLAPAPWRPAASTGPDGVTITSIAAAAGREWHTVVVAGCVEGELPRPRVRTPLFDVTLLGGDPPSLARERRLFAVATSRATVSLVATAAPEPGVLLSRFVEAWPEERACLPPVPGRLPPVRATTAGPTPTAPDRRLVLSASQLDTYDDCPLRYAYQYVLRARDEPGVHASLGSLVHEVLAAFCDPDRPDPPPHTLAGLLGVAEAHWRDDVARYRPQVEEVRRALVDMLTLWWEHEGGQAELAPDVLAVERRFEIEVGPHQLVGFIDRVDRADDGTGLRVVDYKTGRSQPRPADVADDLQLAVYHLAATRDAGLAALGAPTQLQLRYLRTMDVFPQPVTDGHAERTEARVLAIADRILDEDFEPAVDANCRTCSFHRLCPLQPEGRQT